MVGEANGAGKGWGFFKMGVIKAYLYYKGTDPEESEKLRSRESGEVRVGVSFRRQNGVTGASEGIRSKADDKCLCL